MMVRKAVIPAAGFGTHFLPATKAIPKVMFPIVDKPVIQIVVEELVEAGIEEIIFVVSEATESIRNHFGRSASLEAFLQKAGKAQELAKVRKVTKLAKFSYVTQREMKGTGHAILLTEQEVAGEPFVVFWADDFILAKPSRAQQLVGAFEKYQVCILGSIKTNKPEDGGRYGFAVGESVEEGMVKVHTLVEKPGVGKAPSCLATVSGFVFTPEIFQALRRAEKEVSARELTYIDGLNKLLPTQPVFACEIKGGRYFDTGNKLEYLKTVVEFGLSSPEVGKDFRKYLRQSVVK